MKQGKMLLTIAAVVVLGIIIQVILIGAETTSTPSKTVIKFTKAYFKLDRSMSKYLCGEFATEEDADAAAEYINRMADEAKTLGFSLNYMRTTLFSVHTDIISKSETEAQVRIRALRKRNLNPVYTIVAQLFFIGETYEVDEILNLVKEDGQWKVCGQAFSLTI
jgi:uncharacterized membrane protein YvbJ